MGSGKLFKFQTNHRMICSQRTKYKSHNRIGHAQQSKVVAEFVIDMYVHVRKYLYLKSREPIESNIPNLVYINVL